MQLSLCSHVGAGYQPVLKTHGNHLDTSSLNTEKVRSLEVKYCPTQDSIAIHPKWEKESSLRDGLVCIPEDTLKVPFLLQCQRQQQWMFCSLGWKNPDTHRGGACTAPSVRNQDSAYDQGPLSVSLIILMNWFVMPNTSVFSFKSINIPEQSFWK